MYNEKGIYYNTSCDDMLKEKDLWNNVIKNSSEILEFFSENESDNYFLAKYIVVLNGARNLNDSYQDYINFIQECEKRKKIDNYKFHRLYKIFMADADAILDYQDKLFKDLKKISSDLNFNRKNHDVIDFSNRVSDIRNNLLHEGVPTMYTDEQVAYTNTNCHANTAGQSRLIKEVYVTVNYRNRDGFNISATKLLDTISNEIDKLNSNLTLQIKDNLKTIKSKLVV